MNVDVTLTTVPFRYKTDFFVNVINRISIEQTINPSTVFINIPKKYIRFKETVDVNYIYNKLKHISNIHINTVEYDRGPCTKYIDVIESNNLNNKLLIVLDDDRIYSKNLIEDYLNGINSFKEEHFNFCIGDHSKIKTPEYSFWCYQNQKWKTHKTYKTLFYMSKIKETGTAGFFGYAFYNFKTQNFIKYHNYILEHVPLSIYHDDAIISNYIQFTENKSLYIDHISCDRLSYDHPLSLIKSEIINRLTVNNLIHDACLQYFKK